MNILTFTSKLQRSNTGSVLIMVLWALGLLTVFTIQIALALQDKMAFLSRASHHQVLRVAARAGVNKAMAVIKNEPLQNKLQNPLQRAWTLYYNPGAFNGISLNDNLISVEYNFSEDVGNSRLRVYGVSDEERRLNLNTADRTSIKRLVMLLTRLQDEDADKLAGYLVDWRQPNDTVLEGFYSDSIYENLQYPYKEKKAPYEILDEIKLVQGMDDDVYQSLIDYVTIYGRGEININTASEVVLQALGFSPEQTKVIDEIRRGPDGKYGTKDDVVYSDLNAFWSNLIQVMELKQPDIDQLNTLITRIPFKTDSRIFRIQSVARFSQGSENKTITCVFDAIDDKIKYWHEE